jgi:hypothetical protein
MNAEELLKLKLDDSDSTLYDVFNSHLIECQFGDVEDEQMFFLQLAQKIIDAVKA